MKKLATSLVALGALAALFVAFTPDSASAGWRRWGGYYGGYGPGVGVYVGPRYGYYGYSPYAYQYRPYAYYPYWRGRHFYRRHYGWY